MEQSKDQITFLDILDTQRCLLFTFGHSNQCKWTIPFCLAQRICTIAENNATKLKNLENLKSNLLKYNYLDLLIKQGFQKSLSVPQKDIRKPKKLSNANILQAWKHLIETSVIFIALLNPQLIVWKIIVLAALIISN